MEITLDAALKRRKEMAAKAGALQSILNVFEMDSRNVVGSRGRGGSRFSKPIFDYAKNQDGTNLVTVTVPRLKKEQVEAEHKFYAMRYRLLDEKIQEANNTTDVKIAKSAIEDAMLIIDDEQIKAEQDAVTVTRKLSSLLSIRKDLNANAGVASNVPESEMIEVVKKELKGGESADELVKDVEIITGGQLLARYFEMQGQLAAVDTVIAEANAKTVIDVPSAVMDDYKKPEVDSE